MDAGHKFGLLLMYSTMAAYALIMLRILIQILFGDAIEDHRRRQWKKQHRAPAHAYRAMAGKAGWANSWLPRRAETKVPSATVKVSHGHAALRLLIVHGLAIILVLTALGLASTVAAQPSARTDSTSDLKKQLIDVQAKEIALRMRLEEVDEELKPESIERELAGIGSVHPEELREHRRKLLTIERNGLQSQLDLLEEVRARIEATIEVNEEAAAYLKYGRPIPAKPSPQPQMAVVLRNFRHGGLHLSKLFGAFAISVVFAAGLALLLLIPIQTLVLSRYGKRRLQRRLLKWAVRFGYTG